MSEEQKVPETPAVAGKPPMPWDKRVATLSWENLKGECNRISKKPETKLSGAIADVLLNVIFKTHNKGNDPYMLERSRTLYLDIHKASVRATTAGGK